MRRSWALLIGERELVLTPGNFTIGRSSSCDLVFDDPRVSRVHAVIRVGIDSAMIEDAGSHNGVLIGGERLSCGHELADGDIIAIGGEELRVRELRSRARKHSRDRTMPEGQVAAIQASVRQADARRETQPDGPAGEDAAAQLSKREREVLVLVARGHTSREIAERLGLSVKTVEGYRARISDKLGLRGRAELVEFALAAGLLSATVARPDG
ncbi:MAG: FHA domain-containing protein [Myxococcales bacterium]|nr:FHA domain-containing protein [Myxococcales bacterium]